VIWIEGTRQFNEFSPGQEVYDHRNEAAWDRAHRPKICKLVLDPALAYIVAEKLQLKPRIVLYRVIGKVILSVAATTVRSLHWWNVTRGLSWVPSKDTKMVINALIKQAHKLPRELYKSLTWDRGKEMADHQRFTLATDIKVYFCDPQQPWQRGSNGNTNGLLRQYFPKGMDLSNVHQNRLNAIAKRLNDRPRETLQFYSPAEKFSECVASTG
jgi:IS30 family transposase